MSPPRPMIKRTGVGGARAYALHMSEHAKKSPPHQIIKRIGVGAYRIRPRRERTRKEVAAPPKVLSEQV